MNITLPKFLTGAKPAPSRAAERYRQYRTTGNGKIEVYLPPQRGDELRAKLIEASKVRDAAVDASASKAEDAIKALRLEFNTRMKAIDAENITAQVKANEAYEATEHALLAEFSQALSPEQVALMTTRVGEVVRVPAQANGGGQ